MIKSSHSIIRIVICLTVFLRGAGYRLCPWPVSCLSMSLHPYAVVGSRFEALQYGALADRLALTHRLVLEPAVPEFILHSNRSTWGIKWLLKFFDLIFLLK